MSTATAPVPAPSPSTPLTPTPGSTHTEPFRYEDNADAPSSSDAFDEMFPGGDAPKEAPKAPAPAPEPAKVASEPTKAPQRPSFDDGLPTEAPKQQEAPKAPVPEPKTNKELREVYQRTLKEVETRDAELEKLRQKLAEPKPETNGWSKEYEAKLKAYEERLAEYETEIKFADYSRSSEYKQQYQAPLEAAVKTANDELASFTVTQADGDERQASFADLRPLLTLQPGAAWKHAKEIFGDAAPAIMAYRNKIVELNAKAQGALEEYRTKGAERSKQQEQEMTAQETKAAEDRIKAFDSHIGSRAQAIPALYGEDPSDAEATKLLQAGRKLTDIAFKGSPDMSDSDLVTIQAEVAARASAFGKVVYQNRKLESQVAELTKKLAAFEKSEPAKGGSDAGAPEVDDGRPSWMADLDKLPNIR